MLSRCCNHHMGIPPTTIVINGMVIDLANQTLVSSGGEKLSLRPQTFATLRFLIENANRLITKSELAEAIWHGVAVTDDSPVQCIHEIRRAIGDDAHETLQTVSKRGYRLIHNDQVGLSGNKPSIAVLPFQNMSGDAEQEYFADGIVEDIITALSRGHWLFVIARNSSFSYKGKAVDVKQVGRELGVRYVLEGSVRKAANRVRITGQLIDTATGAHLWADRFDGEMVDVFDLQDRVTAGVVGAILPKLEEAEIERSRRKPTKSLDAYDYYLRGMAAFHAFSKENNAAALEFFYKALELDPKFASPYGMVARCYLQRKGFNWVTDREHEAEQTARMARQAAELGRNDPIALAAAGSALVIVLGDFKGGLSLIEQSLAINPNLAWAVMFSANAMAYLGDPEGALARATLAMRLSPQDPQMFGMQLAAAWPHFFACRFEEALSWTEAALRGRPDFFLAICVEAASAAMAGKLDQARRAMARIREINPNLRVSNLKDLLRFERQKDFDLWIEGLREAGLPE